MKLTENEKAFVKTVVDYNASIFNIQNYIKETYNIDSEYDEENNKLKLLSNNKDNAINLVNSKNYIQENYANIPIDVIYG